MEEAGEEEIEEHEMQAIKKSLGPKPAVSLRKSPPRTRAALNSDTFTQNKSSPDLVDAFASFTSSQSQTRPQTPQSPMRHTSSTSSLHMLSASPGLRGSPSTPTPPTQAKVKGVASKSTTKLTNFFSIRKKNRESLDEALSDLSPIVPSSSTPTSSSITHSATPPASPAVPPEHRHSTSFKDKRILGSIRRKMSPFLSQTVEMFEDLSSSSSSSSYSSSSSHSYTPLLHSTQSASASSASSSSSSTSVSFSTVPAPNGSTPHQLSPKRLSNSSSSLSLSSIATGQSQSTSSTSVAATAVSLVTALSQPLLGSPDTGRTNSTSKITLATTKILNPIFEARLSLVKLMAAENFGVTNALCQLVEIWLHDEVAIAMLLLFGACRQLPRLLQWAIRTELSAHKEGSEELFRGYGLRIRLVTNYISTEGADYLQQVIGSHIKKLCDSNVSMELDPNKLQPDEDLKANQESMTSACTAFLEDVFNSLPSIPLSIRVLFSTVKKAMSSQSAQQWNIVAGSLFFLRFMCPALVSPDRFGLVSEPPSAIARRTLILVSKILQSVSNCGGNSDELDEKETYMRSISSFITSFREPVVNFFSELAKVPEDGAPVSPWESCWSRPPARLDVDMTATINAQLRVHQDKIQSMLEQAAKKSQKKKVVTRFKRYSVRWDNEPTPRAKLLSRVHQEIRLRSQLTEVMQPQDAGDDDDESSERESELSGSRLILPSSNPTQAPRPSRKKETRPPPASAAATFGIGLPSPTLTRGPEDPAKEQRRMERQQRIEKLPEADKVRCILMMETELTLLRLALEAERTEKANTKKKYRNLKRAYYDLQQKQEQQQQSLRRLLISKPS